MAIKHIQMLDIDFDKWFDVNFKSVEERDRPLARSAARAAWETAGSIQYARGYEDGLNRVHE